MKIVIKIGSNIIADGRQGLNQRRIAALASNISAISGMGHEIAVVSSGAIAAGMKRLGLKSKPSDIRLKQAAAAVGQSALMWTYEKCFAKFKRKVGQVLLTRDVLSDRAMYINAKNTLVSLISHGIIPIINENDTVATDEIRFGDNDNLAFLVASLLEADRLIILSDVEGLYDDNPKENPEAALIPSVKKITPELLKKAGKSISGVGTGGMYSKLLAADKAVKSGIAVNIINGKKPSYLLDIVKGHSRGTEFTPEGGRMSARKGWIAFASHPKGTLTLDSGAVRAVTGMNKSLLPSGIVKVEGSFGTGDAVFCVDNSGSRVAKGLANYSSDEIINIMGKKTSEIERTLGFTNGDEIIHRDNLVVISHG